jgi:hypothetical protein
LFSVKRDGVIVITETAPQPREPDHILRQAIHRQYPLDTCKEVFTLTERKPEVAVAAAQERMAAKMSLPCLVRQTVTVISARICSADALRPGCPVISMMFSFLRIQMMCHPGQACRGVAP